MGIKRRYTGDGMVWIQIDDGDEFPVHHSAGGIYPESRRAIIVGESDDHPQPWWGELNL